MNQITMFVCMIIKIKLVTMQIDSYYKIEKSGYEI